MFRHLLNTIKATEDTLPVYAMLAKTGEELTEENFSGLRRVISDAVEANPEQREAIGASCVLSLYRLFEGEGKFQWAYDKCLAGMAGLPEKGEALEEFLAYVDDTAKVSGDEAPERCLRLKEFRESGEIPMMLYLAAQQSLFEMCVTTNLFPKCGEAVRFMAFTVAEHKDVYSDAVRLHMEFYTGQN